MMVLNPCSPSDLSIIQDNSPKKGFMMSGTISPIVMLFFRRRLRARMLGRYLISLAAFRMARRVLSKIRNSVDLPLITLEIVEQENPVISRIFLMLISIDENKVPERPSESSLNLGPLSRAAQNRSSPN